MSTLTYGSGTQTLNSQCERIDPKPPKVQNPRPEIFRDGFVENGAEFVAPFPLNPLGPLGPIPFGPLGPHPPWAPWHLFALGPLGPIPLEPLGPLGPHPPWVPWVP